MLPTPSAIMPGTAAFSLIGLGAAPALANLEPPQTPVIHPPDDPPEPPPSLLYGVMTSVCRQTGC